MARSRDALKEAKWLRLLGQWQASGKHISTFCDQVGITQPDFFRWRRVLTKRGLWPEATVPAMPLFVPLEVESELVGVAIEVVLPGGAVVRVRPGFDAATLQGVLAVLEGQSC